MFKRSGALSSTRKTGRKHSPLPKRSSRKDGEVTEKGGDKSTRRKASAPQLSVPDLDCESEPIIETEHENLELNSESIIESVQDAIQEPIDNSSENQNQGFVRSAVDESSQSLSIESIVHIEAESEVDLSAQDCVDNLQSVDNCTGGLRSAADSTDRLMQDTLDQQACEDLKLVPSQDSIEQVTNEAESRDLADNFAESVTKIDDVTEEVSDLDTRLTEKSSDLADETENKPITDLLVDAEDSETFQDLSSKPDIVVEREVEVEMSLEMKKSDTSGLASRGVISLQYPDDDVRSLDSVNLDDSKLGAEAPSEVVCNNLNLLRSCFKGSVCPFHLPCLLRITTQFLNQTKKIYKADFQIFLSSFANYS